MLAYSRGALVALALGLALWFCIVPLRLRGAAVLLAGALGAGLVVAWDFSQHALSTEGVALHARVTAGRQLGALLVAMLVAARRSPGSRSASSPAGAHLRARRAQNAGAVLLALLALAVIAFAGALAVSHRGLTGSISHGFHTLTNTHARGPRQHARAPDRDRQRARALLERGAAGLPGPPGARRRARKATGPPACATAPRTSKSNTPTASSCRRSPTSASSVWRSRSRCSSPGWRPRGAATHPFNRRWTSWRARRTALGGAPAGDAWICGSCALHARAHRHAEHALPGRRVRRPLARGLDLVRARRRLRGAALRRLARGARAAGPRLRPSFERRRQRWPMALGDASPAAGAAGSADVSAGAGRASSSARDLSPLRARCRRAPWWSRRCSPPGRSGSRSARKTPPRKRSRSERQRSRRARAAAQDARRTATRSRPSAVHALDGPAGRRPERAGARDARAGGAPAALQPADLVGARRVRPAAPATRSGRAERAARGHLPEPAVDRAAVERSSTTPKRSRSRTTTSKRCARRRAAAVKPRPSSAAEAVKPRALAACARSATVARDASSSRRAPGSPAGARTSTVFESRSPRAARVSVRRV